MTLEAWIYARPTAWAALSLPVAHGYPYKNSVTGQWKTYLGEFEVYNVIGSESEIQALVDALSIDVAEVFAWEQGPGFDSLDAWPTDPEKILAVMRDVETYLPDGTPALPVPATIQTPNWGHVFFGQRPRIFAGDFNGDFNRDFL